MSVLAGSVTVSALLNPETLPLKSRARTRNECVVPGVRWRSRVEVELALAITAPSMRIS